MPGRSESTGRFGARAAVAWSMSSKVSKIRCPWMSLTTPSGRCSGGRSRLADPGGDVHDHQMRERNDPGRRHRDRGQPAHRHADQRAWLRWQAFEPFADRDGARGRMVVPVLTPIRMAVSRQVDGDKRPVQGHGHGIPRVRVLPAAVQEDQLRRVGSPHQPAERDFAGRPRFPVHRGPAAPWNSLMRRVGLKKSELVVLCCPFFGRSRLTHATSVSIRRKCFLTCVPAARYPLAVAGPAGRLGVSARDPGGVRPGLVRTDARRCAF